MWLCHGDALRGQDSGLPMDQRHTTNGGSYLDVGHLQGRFSILPRYANINRIRTFHLVHFVYHFLHQD